MERPQPKGPLGEQVPVKGLQVSEVENKPVALCYRPVANSFRADDPENVIGAAAGLFEPCLQVALSDSGGNRCAHGSRLLGLDAALAWRFQAKPQNTAAKVGQTVE